MGVELRRVGPPLKQSPATEPSSIVSSDRALLGLRRGDLRSIRNFANHQAQLISRRTGIEPQRTQQAASHL